MKEIYKGLNPRLTENDTRDLIRYGSILRDFRNELQNARQRIIQLDGTTYYHRMKGGEVTDCYEIIPIPNTSGLYGASPDGIHEIRFRLIEGKDYFTADVMRLDPEGIRPGMKTTADLYCGSYAVEYVGENAIRFNGTEIPVCRAEGYVIKVNKESISSDGGAKGLFCFLDHIAMEGKVTGTKAPLFAGVYEIIANRF